MKVIYDKIQFFGGAERVLLQINKSLNPTKIATLCYVKNPPMEEIRKKIIYPKWGFLFKKFKFFAIFYPFVCFLCSFYKVDDNLVFCYSSSNGKFFNIRAKKKILYTNFPARGIVEPEKFVKNKILLILLKFFIYFFKKYESIQYRKFDKIYCISNYTKDLLLRHYDVKSSVIYCPTSELFFSKKFVNNSKKDFFVLVSRIENHKNLEFVLETFSKINEKLIVLGTGSLLNKFSNKYPKIKFKGYVTDEEMIQIISSSKASIIPTKNEYSMPIIESFARGTPVISINCPAAYELVLSLSKLKGINLGITFEKPSVNSLKKAINRFNKNQKNYRSNEIKNFSKIFSPSYFDAKIKKIISDI